MKNKLGSYINNLMTTVRDTEEKDHLRQLAVEELQKINNDVAGFIFKYIDEIETLPDLRFSKPSMAFIAVDFPAPFGPRIATISPRSTLTVQDVIMSGPPYPPVIFSPEKKAIYLYPFLVLEPLPR